MNTVQLECFLHVAKWLSFSKAAELLSLTQPAVSHQIHALEEELDVELFHRNRRFVALTQAGQAFLPEAASILHSIHQAKDKLSQSHSAQHLAIGYTNHLELEILPNILTKMRVEFPNLIPSIHYIDFHNINMQLEDGNVDLIFCSKNGVRKSSLKYRELRSTPYCCVVSADHPLAQNKKLTLEQLEGPIVVFPKNKIEGPVENLQNLAADLPTVTSKYYGDGGESALALVKAGFGFTILPEMIHQDPSLKFIPFQNIPSASFGAYYTNKPITPHAKRFLDLVEEYYALHQS